MKRSHLGFAAVLVLGVPAAFYGAIIEVLTPQPPLIVASDITYAIVHDGPSTGNYSLRSRCFNDPPLNFGNDSFQADPSFVVTEDRVGVFDAHFGAEEIWDPEFGPEWFYRTETYGFVGPDNDVIASGLNVDSANGVVELRFQVRHGNLQIGAQIDGKPQERVELLNPANQPYEDSGWKDPTPNKYYWDTATYDTAIVDRKSLDVNNIIFIARAVGQTVLRVRHRNRFAIKNCHGEYQYCEFASRILDHVKTGPDTFKIVQVNP